MVERYGYNGRLLRVDLTTRSIAFEARDEIWWRTYAGGGLLATELLLRETDPGIDPFDPENLLVVASSVIAGQPYAGLARFTVVCQEPTHLWDWGRRAAEGPFAIALKRSGVDAIIVRGQAAEPAILVIDNGKVSIESASDLWGKTTGSATQELWWCFGPSRLLWRRLVPQGRIVFVRQHCIGSQPPSCPHGTRAVAGSKLLKAIVIRGGSLPPVADRMTCEEAHPILSRSDDDQRSHPLAARTTRIRGLDPSVDRRHRRLRRELPHERIRGVEFVRSRTLHAPDMRVTPRVPVAPTTASSDSVRATTPASIHAPELFHQEITGALGPNIGLTDLDSVLAANVQCNELGMDPDSLGFTISMAMECRERELLPEDFEPDIPGFGDAPGVIRLIDAIGNRTGAGHLLAEGSKRAAARIGKDAEALAMQVKGLELVPFEPRTQIGLALGYATAPIGPRFDIAEHDWDFDADGWSHALEDPRTFGILQRIPMQEISARKMRNYESWRRSGQPRTRSASVSSPSLRCAC